MMAETQDGLRKRSTVTKGEPDAAEDNGASSEVKQETRGETEETDNVPANEDMTNIEPGTYWLTRIVLLRFLGFIYCVAFTVALHQNRALIGKNGLLPANTFLDQANRQARQQWLEKLQLIPTLLWWGDYHKDLDMLLDVLAYAGLTLSGLLLLTGCSNIILMLTLWLLYHSIVNVGQRWYGFGWESQLLETGFLAAFICPLLSVRQFPRKTPTPLTVIWGYRWLIFRIMLGAGLIKIRGDKCWRDLTCMHHHYETQPVPNPIAYYMHQSPDFFHKFEVLVNHFVELVAPFLLVLPRPLCLIGGIIQIKFQVILIISGNLSFLNWLTILPSLACFDDRSLAWMFSRTTRRKVRELQIQANAHTRQEISWGCAIRRVFNIGLGIVIAYLSIPIVQNLISERQVMNTSFDPLRIVNTYGAFGSVTKERTEIIFQGTYDFPGDAAAKWEEYEFKCKPGSVTRRPCLISPYHYRLDWLLWFAAFQSYQYNPWIIHLVAKLLANDEQATSLIEKNPFEGRDPPKYIRIEHYRYTYTKIGSRDAKNGAWWKRVRKGEYLPPVDQNNLKDYLKQMGWKTPRLPGQGKPKKTKRKKPTT